MGNLRFLRSISFPSISIIYTHSKRKRVTGTLSWLKAGPDRTVCSFENREFEKAPPVLSGSTVDPTLFEDFQRQWFPCPFFSPQISSQKAVPVPVPSPLIASKASSASSLLSPSLLLSLSLLSHSLRPLRFSLCFSSIWSCSFFFCSSSSANRFLAAGSNVLGNASPPGTIAGTEAR